MYLIDRAALFCSLWDDRRDKERDEEVVRKVKRKLLQKAVFLPGFSSVAVEGTNLSDCLSGSHFTEFINKLVLSNGEMLADPDYFCSSQKCARSRRNVCLSVSMLEF